MKHQSVYFFLAIILVWLAGSGLSAEEKPRTNADAWLILGPVDIGDTQQAVLKGDKAVLDFSHLQTRDLHPVAGRVVRWSNGDTVSWRQLEHPSLKADGQQVVYLATYLQTQRWLTADLVIEDADTSIAVFLNGASVSPARGNGLARCALKLTNGEHVVLIKLVMKAGGSFSGKIWLEPGGGFEKSRVVFSTSPLHRIQPRHVLNTHEVRDVSLSPDGRRVAVQLRRAISDQGRTVNWWEILDARNGRRLFSSEYFGRMDNLVWLKNSVQFTYTRTAKDKTDIYVYDLPSHTQQCLVKGIGSFSTYSWADNNAFMVYSTYSRQKEKGYKHIKKIPERGVFSGYKYAHFIYYPDWTGKNMGTRFPIGSKEENFNRALISPDGGKILLVAEKDDYSVRPFHTNTVTLYDVRARTKTKLLETQWINNIIWAPDSTRLLLLGGPSALKGIGKNLPEGTIPNDYDVQAFIYDTSNNRATAISRDFDPSINTAVWNARDNDIYFQAVDRSRVGLFRYSVKTKRFKPVGVQAEVLRSMDVQGDTCVYWGSSATVPYKLYRVSLSSGKGALLKDYDRGLFDHVKLGRVEDWDFTSAEGRTVIGRLYYPVDFDPQKKYPCIVYYYGGTSPVERDFGGRYPKNWYAANGYVVYVLQPTGAVGFGQAASAIHVNDWGGVTAREVIDGIDALLKAKSFIDPTRIGAMGASYGGFLTQYLATQTDRVSAYISHAGISALSSYWGIGDWGVDYSMVATANSFPWNRRDIYVERSPLYLADKINSPILLLHGQIDNNVPPGESYQMFAALKLLGKEVALVTFKGQRHWILEYPKRLRWMHTIIAWFDKWLKNQAEHWEDLYPQN
jgi:dipeptidyl aminopeptidase/acylaminoacyl peptidase